MVYSVRAPQAVDVIDHLYLGESLLNRSAWVLWRPARNAADNSFPLRCARNQMALVRAINWALGPPVWHIYFITLKLSVKTWTDSLFINGRNDFIATRTAINSQKFWGLLATHEVQKPDASCESQTALFPLRLASVTTCNSGCHNFMRYPFHPSSALYHHSKSWQAPCDTSNNELQCSRSQRRR